MKIRCERNYPEAFLTGILLHKEFKGEWPDNRNHILRKQRDCEFKERVASELVKIPDRVQNASNLKKLADFFQIKLMIKVDQEITSYGDGEFMK